MKDIDIKIYLYFSVNWILRPSLAFGRLSGLDYAPAFAVAYESGKACKGMLTKRYFCNICDEITSVVLWPRLETGAVCATCFICMRIDTIRYKR